MKKQRGLPIPFLVLILAGVVSAFSILMDGGSRAGKTGDHSLQIQTVEQERMAAIYFRVLSWLSSVTPRATEPPRADPQPAPVLKPTMTPPRRQRPGRIELCTFHSRRDSPADKLRTQTF